MESTPEYRLNGQWAGVSAKRVKGMIEIELSRIIISEINSQQVIFLKEKDGPREFPIIIGIYEATCIDRRVKGFQPQRPMTHDLIVSIVEMLGGVLKDVHINRLEGTTFFASLRITKGNELIEIDARPSDAIALAISEEAKLPIFVEEDVLERAIAQNF